jgi:hypothetical protein
MPWWHFALLGAAGGVIVEVLGIFRWVKAWQDSRRCSDGTIQDKPPKLARYLDIPAHCIMLPARAALRAAAAIVFGLTGQVTGPYGALAFGCVAPLMLARVGMIPQVANAINAAPNPRSSRPADVVAGLPGQAPLEEGSLQ